MKDWKGKTHRALLNKRGEMLIETVISSLIFIVLITSVTGIITSATNHVRETQREQERIQEAANELVQEGGASGTMIVNLTFPEASGSSVPRVASGVKTEYIEGLLYFSI